MNKTKQNLLQHWPRRYRSWNRIRQVLSQPPAVEHSPAMLRLAAGVVMTGYLSAAGLPPYSAPITSLFMPLLGWLLALALIAGSLLDTVLLKASDCASRRLGMCALDCAFVSYGLYLAGAAYAPFLLAYVGLILLHGLDARPYMVWACAALGLAGFALAAALSPYWSGHYGLWGATAAGLIVLTAAASALARALENAREAGTLAQTSGEPIAIESASVVADDLALQEDEVDLSALLNDVVRASEPLIRQSGLTFTLTTPGELPRALRADRLRLSQLLGTLLKQASSYLAAGRLELTLSVLGRTRDQVQLQFDIIATGPLRDEKAHTKTPYEDAYTARPWPENTPLMAIAARLVELMDGEWGSERAAHCHRLWLKAALALPEPATARGKPAVLLLCQDAGISRRLQARIGTWGFPVRLVKSMARSFAEAGDGFNARRYGFAVVHEAALNLPAPEYARALRSETASETLKVILLGHSDSDAKTLAQTGITAVIGDPLNMPELFLALHGSAPPAQANVVTLADKRAARPAAVPLSLLLADDNATVRKLIERILLHAGHRVSLAENGEQALQALSDKGFDAAILDLHMPELNGLEVVQRFRFIASGKRHTPVIAITARESADTKAACLAAGFDGFLSKPIMPEALLALLGRLTRPAAEPGNNAKTSSGDIDAPVLDADTVRQLLTLSEDRRFFAEITASFCADCEHLLQAMAQALATGDRPALIEQAFALKSCALSIGARALGARAGIMAQLNRKVLAQEGDALLEQLGQDYKAAKTALETYPDSAAKRQ